jgi:hypothetical protein
MQYSTLGFFETLKPAKRSLWRTDFIEPYSLDTYGYIIKVWPITYLKIKDGPGSELQLLSSLNESSYGENSSDWLQSFPINW